MFVGGLLLNNRERYIIEYIYYDKDFLAGREPHCPNTENNVPSMIPYRKV
jgi:hypothetical protein